MCGKDDYSIVYHSNIGQIIPTVNDYTSTINKYCVYNNIVQCNNCGLIYMNPQDAAVEKLYKDVVDDAYLDSWDERAEVFKNHLKIISEYKNSGKILDIGCYAGIFIDEAQKKGYEVNGIEPSEWAAAYARKKTGVLVINACCNEKQFFTDKDFDVVTLWDVIEHLSNPSLTLSNVYSYLKEEGIVVITTHDIGSFIAKIMGKRYPWLMRFHLFHFTPKTLGALLEKNKFEILSTRYYSKKFKLNYLLSRFGIKTKAEFFKKISIPVNLGDMFMIVAKKKKQGN